MKTLLLAALSILALAGCSHKPSPSKPKPAPTAKAASADAPTLAKPIKVHVQGNTRTKSVSLDLANYHWQLSSATAASGQRINALFVRPDKPLQLDFDAHGVAIANGCNAMHADATVSGDKLNFGRMISTMMACADPALNAMDKAIGKYLHGSYVFVLRPNNGGEPELTFGNAHGDTFNFKGVATAQTRFGSKGETIFLEIASAAAPCGHPTAGTSCLFVRQVHYAKNGTRTGSPGPWQVLNQPIEGYRHHPGTHNIVRVGRYKATDAAAAAGAPSTAYVLEMVVESSVPSP